MAIETKKILNRTLNLGEVLGRADPGTEFLNHGQRFIVAERGDGELIAGITEVIWYKVQIRKGDAWDPYLMQWGRLAEVGSDFKVTRRVHPSDASPVEKAFNKLRDKILGKII